MINYLSPLILGGITHAAVRLPQYIAPQRLEKCFYKTERDLNSLIFNVRKAARDAFNYLNQLHRNIYIFNYSIYDDLGLGIVLSAFFFLLGHNSLMYLIYEKDLMFAFITIAILCSHTLTFSRMVLYTKISSYLPMNTSNSSFKKALCYLVNKLQPTFLLTKTPYDQSVLDFFDARDSFLINQFYQFSISYQNIHTEKQENEIYDNLLTRETLPKEFEDDPIFKKNVCLITLCPIRFPVLAPRTKTPYEKAAIEAWIEKYHTSPFTRDVLNIEDLKPMAELQKVIDDRLKGIQEGIDYIRKFKEDNKI